MSIWKDGTYHPLGAGGEMSETEYEYQYGLCNEGPDDDCDPPPVLELPIGYWRTRELNVLRVREMSRSHIENAIELFTRMGWADHLKIEELRLELAAREDR